MGKIEKLIPWAAATALSYVGWYIGAKGGIFLAFIVSMVGFAVGLYYGKKWVAENI